MLRVSTDGVSGSMKVFIFIMQRLILTTTFQGKYSCAHFRDAETETQRGQCIHPTGHRLVCVTPRPTFVSPTTWPGAWGSFHILCSLPVGQWLVSPVALGAAKTPTLPFPACAGAPL